MINVSGERLPVRRCTRCLYDEHTPRITFDQSRRVQLLRDVRPAGRRSSDRRPKANSGSRRSRREIRKAGQGKKYDCIVGVSGGCDSSYTLYLAKTLGLRPLAVHFDNTWNSTIATENIRNVLKALDVDLYTYVVDNEEYDDIYRSFLEAGVIDIEAPTDIALAAVIYRAASKFGVRYIARRPLVPDRGRVAARLAVHGRRSTSRACTGGTARCR